MRIHSRRLIVAVGAVASLAAAVSVAACGGGSGSKSPTAAAPSGESTASASPTTAAGAPTPPQASSGDLDACALVSKADVEAAIGKAVLDPKPQQFPGLASCDFNDPSASAFRLAGVNVVTEASSSDAQSLFDFGKSNANDPQQVDGVGEDAYWDATLNTLDTVQGKYEITIDVAPDEGVDTLTAAKAIAAKVLANLP
jgi:hypothetical protein